MRIAEAARALGISSSWLRQLERQGIIPPATRDLSGDRRYTEGDVARLRALIFALPSSATPE
jgi:DNA-binding transcriptional MerR regulator